MKKALVKTPLTAGGGLEEAQKEMLELLRGDSRLCSLIRDEFHLSIAEIKFVFVFFLDFYDDFYYCDACPGYQSCAKEIPHYQMELFREDGLIDRRLHLCPLAKKVERLRSYFLYRDFPESWSDESLKTSVERSEKKKKALVFLSKILSGKSSVWPYVTGNRGCGRTFLLACFALDFARGEDEPQTVAFCDTPSLVEKLRSDSFQAKEKFAKEIEELTQVPLLVLDDFGSEMKDKSGFAYSSILFPILNARAKENRLTAFSSDFKMGEIAQMYAPSIGFPRARQLQNLLRSCCGEEMDLTGLVFSGKRKSE